MIRNILIAVYIFIILGISATVRAEENILPVFGASKQLETLTVQGDVVLSVDGIAYLAVSEDKAFELQSNVDLADYNGLHVSIEGVELKYKVQPIEMSSIVPLTDGDRSEKVAPVLVVLTIRELTE